MPAKSEAQRRLFAIAEHSPGELYAKNKLLGNLPKSTLHDFAATKEKGLPKKVKVPKKPVVAVKKISKKPPHPARDAIRNR